MQRARRWQPPRGQAFLGSTALWGHKARKNHSGRKGKAYLGQELPRSTCGLADAAPATGCEPGPGPRPSRRLPVHLRGRSSPEGQRLPPAGQALERQREFSRSPLCHPRGRDTRNPDFSEARASGFHQDSPRLGNRPSLAPTPPGTRAGAHSPRTSPGRPPAPQPLRKLSQGTARSTPRGKHGWGGLCVVYAADREAGELDSHARLGVGFSKALERFCPVGEFCHFWEIGKVCGYALHATCSVGGRDPVKPGGPASWGHSPRPAPGDKHRTRAWRSLGGSHARGTHQGSTPRSGPSGGHVLESPKHTRGKRYTVAERPKDHPPHHQILSSHSMKLPLWPKLIPGRCRSDAMSYGLPGGGQKGPSSPTRSVSRRGCWESAPTKGQRLPEVPPGDPPPEEFQPGDAKYCLFVY